MRLGRTKIYLVSSNSEKEWRTNINYQRFDNFIELVTIDILFPNSFNASLGRLVLGKKSWRHLKEMKRIKGGRIERLKFQALARSNLFLMHQGKAR